MRTLYFLFFVLTLNFNIFAEKNQRCLVLVDPHDTENIGSTHRYFLISKLQSAIAEKSVPILMQASLWNAFIERRVSFNQNSQKEGANEYKTLSIYNNINKRINFWVENNTISDVVERINEEFYQGRIDVSDLDFQLLLNHLTSFDPSEWSVYKKHGFYLFIPKNYPAIGFKTENLENADFFQDVGLSYFESQRASSLVKVIPEFFKTHYDISCQWDIVLSGHGGSSYEEENDRGKVSWNGEPIISALTLNEFKELLDFFQTRIKTHLLHYSSCYAGGNHIALAFDKTYTYPIICDSLTDCATFCKWTNVLPSTLQKALSVDDLEYDSTKKIWDLRIKSPYSWGQFFDSVSRVEFSPETTDQILNVLTHITHPIIANISLLRLPNADQFYPLTTSDTVVINGRDTASKNALNTLLIEQSLIDHNLVLNNADLFRIISIKPGKAQHYIKKLVLKNPIDLPSIFWQAEFQTYDKIFLIDDFEFSDTYLKNVFVKQQNFYDIHFLRIFFTVGDKAMMVVAKKMDQFQLDEKTTVLESIELSPDAKLEYEQIYMHLKREVPRI